MLETQDEKSAPTSFSIPDQQRDVRLQESFRSAIATSFEWDIESDTFVRDYSSEPALPASRELPRSLSQTRNVVSPMTSRHLTRHFSPFWRAGHITAIFSV